MQLRGNPDIVEIRDLSASGVCCTTLEPLAVMTQVHLVLVLPSDPAPRGREVAVDGVVVRCARDGSAPPSRPVWEVAIFFTGVVDVDREALASLVVSLRGSGLVA